jgi:hypothetical protein
LEGCRNGPTSANGSGANGWTEVTSSAPWAARYGLTGTVYNGNMWIIGGASGSGSVTNYYGDVWESSNGKNWSETTSNASFGARYNPQVVTFANGGVTQLYLIGGNEGGILKNDVWTSPDGANWTQILANNSAVTKNNQTTQFCPRQDFSAIVFNNLIYVIGGADVTVGSDGLNDVWSSPDGINWTEVLAYAANSSNTQFAPRWGAAAVSFNNNLYLVGGHGTPTSTIEGDSWSSANGLTWNVESGSIGSQYYEQIVANSSAMWLTGGYAPYNGGADNDFVMSTNWATWSGQGAEPFNARFGHLSLFFNNEIWIMGGCDNTSSLTYYNDVWYH